MRCFNVIFPCLLSLALSASAASQFAVTPYLQRPALDAMTIIFFTDSACTATVEAGLANAAGTPRLRETTTGEWAQALTNNLVCGDSSRTTGRLYRHGVRFKGLESNRIYDYTVTLEGGATYSNSFRTAPDRNTPIRFVAYADCETKSNPLDNYVKNLAQMKARDPDFIAIPGDLVARGGIQSYWDGFWRANAGDRGEIAGSIPLLTVLGNHDLYDNGVKGDLTDDYKYDLQGETGTDRYLAYFENEPNGVEYRYRDGTDIPETRKLDQLFHRVDYGPVTLIFLDTNDGDNSGDHSRDTNYETRTDTNRYRPGIDRGLGGRHPDFNPGTPQYTWLTNNLADAQAKSRFTFVLNHHCPYSIGSHNNSPTSGKTGGSSQPVRILTETMVRYGVDGWLCGHDEILEHSITNGWEILPDGSKRKHTLSIYDLGCSGDEFRTSNSCKNPLEYFKVTTSNYGFLEVDVNTNKSGRWTCSLTPVDVSGGSYKAQADQTILVESPDRGENENDLVYAQAINASHSIDGAATGNTKPASLGWVAWQKPPEGSSPVDPPAEAAAFAVTPYLQNPAKDAMTIIFFTTGPGTATVEAGLANAAGTPRLRETTTGVWAQALTNNVYQLKQGEERNKWNNSLYKHRVRFEGLESNRIYDYTVTLAGGMTYSNQFRTAPDRNTPIRFVSYADCETKQSKRFSGYTLNLKKMQSRDPDLITSAGDLTARGGIQSHWDEFWMQNAGGNDIGYTDILGSIPMITAIGNHDLFDNVAHSTSGYYHDAQGEFATEKFLSYFEFNSNNVPYTVRDGTNIPETRDMSQLFHREDYGPVTLIFLDSNNGRDCKDKAEDERASSDGIHDQDSNYCKYTNTSHEPGGMNRWKGARHPDFNPGSPQYDWLTNQLADAQAKSRFTFVFNHHCPYSAGSHNKSWKDGEDASSLPLRVLTETMVRYGVEGWYCGHDELLEHAITNGWEYLPESMGGGRRRHTLSIYDLGCSGDDDARGSSTMPPLGYWIGGSSNYGGSKYGFLETDVTTNKNGKWTCTITPIQGSTGNPLSAQIVYVENPDRGESENDLVYAQATNASNPIDGASQTRPSDWLPWTKPPEGSDDDPGYWIEDPVPVTATKITYNRGEQTGEQFKGFATEPGREYAWGKNGKPATEWVKGDGTPCELKKPEGDGWELMVR